MTPNETKANRSPSGLFKQTSAFDHVGQPRQDIDILSVPQVQKIEPSPSEQMSKIAELIQEVLEQGADSMEWAPLLEEAIEIARRHA